MPSPDQVRAAAESHAKLFSAGDKEAWLELFAHDVQFVDPYPSPPLVGRGAISEFWDRTHAMADDYAFDVRQLVTAGDRAVLTFTLSMSLGGQRYAFDGVDVFELDDAGRVRSFTAYWDPTAVRQL